MEERIFAEDSGEIGTAARLIDSGIGLIAEGGLRALTIRDVAASAGIAFPSLQYHFPTKARLVDQIFAAVERRHIADTERAVAALALETGGAEALPGIVAAVLGDWCGQHRATTIAAHELLLVARRDPAYAEPGRRWIDGQLRVWSGLIGRLGLGDDPSLAAFVLELLLGLSLMTFGCDNPVEAALANDEIVRYAFADAEGRRAFDPRWYRMFLARADREVLPTEDAGVGSANDTAHPAARKILDAGIGIVAEEGSGALTFRGVAARAGVAISSVTNNFHTRENLIYSVYRRIQDSMAEVSLRAPPSSPPPPPGDFVPDSQIALLKRVSTGEFPLFLAAYDLMLAGARDPRFGARAWRIRITRGVYLLVRRGVMPAPPLRAQFRSHVSSLWMNAVGLLSGIGGAAPEDRHALIEERLRAGFDRLR